MGAQGKPKKETSRKKTKPKAVDEAGDVSIEPISEDKPKNEKKTQTQQERKIEVIFVTVNV